ncbi:hypothetical protein BCR41DRAFT_370194 [Lobosporangium transversale]|uniref:Uncharacterized protein n=1 Tax=Lobosporangium transversale TaxID=64571 RepID=A0A1Y2GRN4_9FUNG|nr:hypothetical protein BCR41DRAFT_370194 [Lobosporangium transversale]ORZ18403.1 hypothetical protein BCR41DRAFT_370194 [Lobosporangium transversale]|eukprot:XP_021882198.1 hypothetical protein BCR41DRAFT_370194 [Lobosporangium transversale]
MTATRLPHRNRTTTATASQLSTAGNATGQMQPLFYSFAMDPEVKESVEDTSKPEDEVHVHMHVLKGKSGLLLQTLLSQAGTKLDILAGGLFFKFEKIPESKHLLKQHQRLISQKKAHVTLHLSVPINALASGLLSNLSPGNVHLWEPVNAMSHAPIYFVKLRILPNSLEP